MTTRTRTKIRTLNGGHFTVKSYIILIRRITLKKKSMNINECGYDRYYMNKLLP